MKKIELELMKDYRYLSKLEHFGGKLLFIETIADLEENGYKQRLHALDPVSGEDGLVLDFGKKLQLDVLKDGPIYGVKPEALKEYEEEYFEKKKQKTDSRRFHHEKRKH